MGILVAMCAIVFERPIRLAPLQDCVERLTSDSLIRVPNG